MPFIVATFPDSFCKQVLDTIATRLAWVVSTSGPTNTDKFGTQHQQVLTLMTVTLTFEPDEVSMCIHGRMGVLSAHLLEDSIGTHGAVFFRGAIITFRKTYTMANESEQLGGAKLQTRAVSCYVCSRQTSVP